MKEFNFLPIEEQQRLVDTYLHKKSKSKMITEKIIKYLDDEVSLGFISKEIVTRIKWYITTYFVPEEKTSIAPEFIQRIDWKLLREQKATLLGIQKFANVYTKEVNALEGIINLIDNIQDFACDEMGLSDKEVFNLNENEEL